MRVNREEILNSLIVQGNMLESDTEGYIAILESTHPDRHFNDPLQELIAGVFSMCLNGTMDPWSIDILGFSKVFSSVVDRNFRDFYSAGFLLQSAWKILSLKSGEAVMRRTGTEEDELQAEDLPDNDYGYGRMVLNDSIDIKEPVIHREKRKVFLVELLDVMKEAYASPERKRQPGGIIPGQGDGNIDSVFDRLHPEEPEKEARAVLDIIRRYGPGDLDLDDIPVEEGMNRQSLMVYCLFLARDGEIEIRQEYPFGPILLNIPSEPRI